MSQKTPSPPEPIVFFLALIATAGVVLLFMDGGARIAGIAMIVIGVGGIVVRKLRAKPEAHANLRTSGADRGTRKRK
jgi:uncharacterized membrane protein YjjP (DUF1212 family)